jgi:tetratricopeptide (TPR) repeat protein
MSRDDYPLYVAGIEAIQSQNRGKTRQILKSPQLSLIEKRLLQVRKMFRNNKYVEAIRCLESLSPIGAFFLGEKYILLAHVWFLKGDFQKSAIFNTLAFEAYTLDSDRRGLFLSLYNLSADYNRMGAYQLSTHYLERSRPYARTPGEHCLILRAEACQWSIEENYDKACSVLSEAFSMADALLPADLTALHSVAADIYFRSKRYETCYEILKRICAGSRKASRDARLAFDIKVVEQLRSGASLPAREGAWQFSDEFSLKWDILRCVQNGEMDRAQKLWKSLTRRLPMLYGEDFSCLSASESSTIFFQYLSRLFKTPSFSTSAKDSDLLKGKLGKLHRILAQSSTPLRKEELIEKIWGTAYDPKFDSRFYKLMERLKKTACRTIITSNRTYSYGADRAA